MFIVPSEYHIHGQCARKTLADGRRFGTLKRNNKGPVTKCAVVILSEAKDLPYKAVFCQNRRFFGI